jgi:GTP-binding protein HflX
VAIVGYTNAGKSTLLNYLTGAGVLAEDKLFATLDATTRKLTLNDGGKILLTDTVGFISKLPHHLVDAFRSTLEEARYADIILHIVDASNDDAALQMKVVYDTLEKLGIGNRPVICAMNKLDLCAPGTVIKDLKADRTVRISAKTGAGVDDLLKAVSDTVKGLKKLLTVTLSYNNAGGLSQIHQFGHIIREEYREDGIYIQAMVPEAVAKKYQQ